jgi:hypothetical protein
MGFINLGTRVGLGTTAEPYEINYNRIRVVNCDDILLVSGSGSGGNQETLIITITYKYHIIYSTIPQVLTNDITYQTRSGYDLEFNLSEYIDLFSEVIASASNIPTAMINAPLVNEFDPNTIQPYNLNPLSGARSFGLSAGIT